MEIQHSLAAHLNVIFHVLPDVKRAIFSNPDRSEIEAAIKCIFANFLERAWKHNFLDSAALEALFSDVFHSIWNFNSFEIFAVLERVRLEPLQCRGKLNGLYRALIEDVSPVFFSVNDFFRT